MEDELNKFISWLSTLPQPALPEKYNSELWNHENFFMVRNPTIVSLNGVKVMMFMVKILMTL